MIKTNRVLILSSLFGILGMIGCEQSYRIIKVGTPQPRPSAKTPTPDLNQTQQSTPPNTPSPPQNPPPVVCDGLSSGSEFSDTLNVTEQTTLQNGISASLYYFDQDPSLENPEATSAQYYIKNGTRIPVEFYFSNLFIPPRNFTQGFQTSGGSLLKDSSGKVLEEFFGLHFESIIQLGSNPSGYYQFGILSDDGAVLYLKTESGILTLNNDGDHTTRMACSSESVVYMNSLTKLPMKLDYYQGPRAGISLVLVWRKLKNVSPPPLEPLCDKNLGFYAFTAPVKGHKLPLWEQLKTRGWKQLEAENFILPNNKINPCQKN